MADTDAVVFARAISRLLGWVYFLCWSLSFYPQPLLNCRRHSTHGLAIDYPTANVLGFVAYTLSTATFLYSPVIRGQYAYRHPASPEPTVRFNDLAFAAHGALLCIITYSQFFPRLWGFEVGARQRASSAVLGLFWGSVLGVTIVALIVLAYGKDGGYDPSDWAWIEVIYAISYVKLIVTVFKYCPQVWVNYKRKSTVGWHIGQILLDFSGGVLSILQLVIDSSLQKDWSGLSGNPAKLGLANISILFDLIFFTQHWILYPSARSPGKGMDQPDEESALSHEHDVESSARL